MNESRGGEYLETDLRLEGRLQKEQFDKMAYGSGDDYLSIDAEVERAKRHGEKFASLHEAYAVILEELDEIWDIVRQKRYVRSELELRKEFIQLAAMAVKGLQSMENFIGGKV